MSRPSIFDQLDEAHERYLARHEAANDNRTPVSFTDDVDASSREPKEKEL